MTRILGLILLFATFSTPAHAQPQPRRAPSPIPARPTSPAPRPLYQPGQTWYEFLFHRLNPTDKNWGAWYQSRREAFVEQIETPFFWYGFCSAATILLLSAGWVKSDYDRMRERRILCEWMDRIRAHDAYSRQVAHEAIRIHNEHVEQCDRVIEALEANKPAPANASVLDDLNQKLDAVRAKVVQANQESGKLQDESGERKQATTNLPTRVAFAAAPQQGAVQDGSPGHEGSASYAELLKQNNDLKQRLYASEQNSKRMKGG